MTRAAAVAVLTVIAIACGPSGASTTDPVPDPSPAPVPVADAGAARSPAADAGAKVVEPAPDPRERCARVVDHMLDVALTEVPETEHATIREKMAADRDRLIDECAAGDLSEAEYECAMAAASAADMQKCGR